MVGSGGGGSSVGGSGGAGGGGGGRGGRCACMCVVVCGVGSPGGWVGEGRVTGLDNCQAATSCERPVVLSPGWCCGCCCCVSVARMSCGGSDCCGGSWL